MSPLAKHLPLRLLALLWLVIANLAGGAQAEPLRGAGATFPAPLYTRWALEYRMQKGVEVRYEAVGSGAGLKRVREGLLDFGATDIPLSQAQLDEAQLLQFPAVIGGVVPVINIGGVASGQLRLTGAVLAEIYLGRITRWNAPAIAALNPGQHLPSANITVVHRADDSGTTFLFSRYLALASRDWTAPAAAHVEWPVGVEAVGNDGVAAMVQRTRMSIGYTEYTYASAHRLSVVALRNHDGAYVQPSVDGFRAAMDVGWASNSDLDGTLLDRPGAASWPITAASFILLPKAVGQRAHSREVIRFFDWALGQAQSSARDLGYLPLPDVAVEKVRQSWSPLLRDRP